jgi:hypothetical protein
VTGEQATLIDLRLYSFDTSAFINGRRDLYKPNTFAVIWDLIDGLIKRGEIRSVDEVKREIAKKDDDAAMWVKQRVGLFVPLAHDVQQATKEVLAACPKLLAQFGADRNAADPFVVGLAMARHGTVVTQEAPGKSLNRPRIPDACKEVEVPCMTLPEFVDDQGWKLGLAPPASE